MNDNIQTVLTDMPVTIHSFVVSNDDGTYTIVLNSRLSQENNILAYWHELRHIYNDDYKKDLSVDTIEFDAHGL